MEWPERDPTYIHVRSAWPQDHENLDLQPFKLEATTHSSQSPLFVPNIWAISDAKVSQISHDQYEIMIGTRMFGFYSPYLQQTPIDLKSASHFTLTTVSLGHSNNWVVCELCETQSRKYGTASVDVEILRKVGVLATDSCSELLIHAGTSLSMLKKINCVIW